MSRDYVTVCDRKVGNEIETVEYTVGPIQLKSVVSRVTKTGNAEKIMGFALTDLTPIKTIEVSIDGGPCLAATLDRQNTATPGDHTVVSRATDINGQVQIAVTDASKKTIWGNSGEFVIGHLSFFICHLKDRDSPK